jgi:hypothetical protein
VGAGGVAHAPGLAGAWATIEQQRRILGNRRSPRFDV